MTPLGVGTVFNYQELMLAGAQPLLMRCPQHACARTHTHTPFSPSGLAFIHASVWRPGREEDVGMRRR